MFRNSDAGAGRTADGRRPGCPALHHHKNDVRLLAWEGPGTQESLECLLPRSKGEWVRAAHDSWLWKESRRLGMNRLYIAVCCGWNGCHSDLEEAEGFGAFSCGVLSSTVRLRDARWVKCLSASVLWGGPFSLALPLPESKQWPLQKSKWGRSGMWH